LSQLNKEKNNRGGAEYIAHQAGGFGGSCASEYQQISFGNGAFVPPNRSICETSLQENVVYSKRFSLGLGNDFLTLPPPFPGDHESYNKSGFDFCSDLMPPTGLIGNKRYKDDCSFGMDDIQPGKKRRLSNVGFYNNFFLDDVHMQRRPSFSSLADTMHFPEEDDDLLQGFDPIEIPHPSAVGDEATPELQAPTSCVIVTPHEEMKKPATPSPSPAVTEKTIKPKKQQPLPLMLKNPEEARETMVSLSDAMEKTQKSQQELHDWDRKIMGLKRSHSKTMRLSTRSRKKLRAMLKKQINALNSANKKR